MADELNDLVAELRALVASQSEQLDRLQRRVFELEGAQRAQPAPGAAVTHIDSARVSRRNMLGKAGAVAAAGVAGAIVGGGVLAQPAAAQIRDDNDPFIPGLDNEVVEGTEVSIKNNEDESVFFVRDAGGPAPFRAFISAYSRNRASGKNMPAFRGDAEASNAFYGTSKNVPAVFATSTGSAGVQGNCTGSGPAGVIGASTNTDGVWGLSTNGTGVHGQGVNGVFGDAPGGYGVHGRSGSGYGVLGESTSSYGVKGQSSSNDGVHGTSTSATGVSASSSSGTGLFAQSSTGKGASIVSYNTTGLAVSGRTIGATFSGGTTYGATFQGGSAALKLVPQSTAGKPTSGLHARGELLCDKNGVLWFCTAGGSPGTWKKVTLT